jgi:hypothetical protein
MNTNNMKRMLNIAIATMLFISCTSCKKDDTGSGSGSIEYTIDGTTYVQTDNVNSVFVSGKFQGLTDDNLDAKVGDGEDISIAIGTTYNGIKLFFKANGETYGTPPGSSSGKVTFSKNESNLLEGTFEGTVKLDGDIANPAKTITGKFTVIDFLRI